MSAIFICVIRKVSDAQEIDHKAMAQEYINQAELMMEAAQPMVDVRDIYVLAADIDPSNVVANWRAGEFHIKTVGKKNAVPYFLKVLQLNPGYRFDIEYWIGRAYHFGMECEKALEYYERYKQKLADKKDYRGKDRVSASETDRKIYECENVLDYVANPTPVSIVSVGSAINTDYEEYGPVLNEDETVMIFTSRRRDDNLNENVFSDNKPYEDIYVSTKENGQWTPSQNIGDVVNTLFHDSNLALSADGNQLFLYKDDNNGDIYESFKNKDGSWTPPSPLSDNINSEGFKEASISISPDGNMLFFASDRPGGQGGIDIYYSIKDKKGRWIKSKNLGTNINTAYDDDAPFIDYDGKTLYFSSLGRKGMGGYDIFKSVYDSAAREWGEPVNLGFPINTPDDDIFFVSTKDGQRGYYASVREDGMGFTDIYMVTMADRQPEPEEVAADDDRTAAVSDEPTDTAQKEPPADTKPVLLTVRVTDESGNPLAAKVTLTGSNNRVLSKTGISEGVFEFKSNAKESHLYTLSVENIGYVFKNTDIRLPGMTAETQHIERAVRLQELRTGTSAVLRNIYFHFNETSFRQESYKELNKLADMMAGNVGLRIEIAGHTDKIGLAVYNKDLSQRRANAVKNFLENKGIDPRRMVAIGYGEEKPLVSNDDEKEGRELNRRVEFQVIR